MAKDKKLKAQIERQLAAISKQQISNKLSGTIASFGNKKRSIKNPFLTHHASYRSDIDIYLINKNFDYQ